MPLFPKNVVCLPVRSNGALHTHLNNETIAKDVRDNC